MYSEPAVFDSGSPYNHDQFCWEEFSCEDSSTALHFKFNRFSLEQGYDYLTITSEDFNFDDSIEYDGDGYMVKGDQSGQNFVLLTGEHETDVWVNAESIQNFGSSSKLRVTFYRQGFEEHFFALQTN